MAKRDKAFRNGPSVPGYEEGQDYSVPDTRNELRKTGTVVKLMAEKGFGFIEDETHKQYFFHRSGVRQNGWAELTLNQPVTFIVRDSPKGPRAEDVEPA